MVGDGVSYSDGVGAIREAPVRGDGRRTGLLGLPYEITAVLYVARVEKAAKVQVTVRPIEFDVAFTQRRPVTIRRIRCDRWFGGARRFPVHVSPTAVNAPHST